MALNTTDDSSEIRDISTQTPDEIKESNIFTQMVEFLSNIFGKNSATSLTSLCFLLISCVAFTLLN